MKTTTLTKDDHLRFTLVMLILLGLVFHTCPPLCTFSFMMAYFLVDLRLFFRVMSQDMIFHHVLSMVLTYSYLDQDEEKQLVLLSTELSTPFLIMYKLGVARPWTKILFVMTFLYYRIYNLGWLLWKERHHVHDMYVWVAYMLWMLNWHWLELILSRLCHEKLQTVFFHMTPYTHFLSVFVIQSTNLGVGVMLSSVFSAVASYYWHTTHHWGAFLMDVGLLHTQSFLLAVACVPSLSKWVSLPFHIMDLFAYYYHHNLWVVLSIGLDAANIFLWKQDLMWMFGWLILGIFYTRQTFGYGNTQSLLHIGIACLLSLV